MEQYARARARVLPIIKKVNRKIKQEETLSPCSLIRQIHQTVATGSRKVFHNDIQRRCRKSLMFN